MRAPGWRGLALLLGGSGVLHLVRPQIYEPLIPASLGSPRSWVIGSGVAEIACAAGLSSRSVRRPAALASAALLVVVFPGNIQHARRALRSSRTSTALSRRHAGPAAGAGSAGGLGAAGRSRGGIGVSSRRSRGRRIASYAGFAVGGVATVAAASATGLATYFTRKVVTPLVVKPDDLEILEVLADRVVLSATPDTLVPGRYGLWLDGGKGHARIGEILSRTDVHGHPAAGGGRVGRAATGAGPVQPVLRRGRPDDGLGAGARGRGGAVRGRRPAVLADPAGGSPDGWRPRRRLGGARARPRRDPRGVPARRTGAARDGHHLAGAVLPQRPRRARGDGRALSLRWHRVARHRVDGAVGVGPRRRAGRADGLVDGRRDRAAARGPLLARVPGRGRRAGRARGRLG